MKACIHCAEQIQDQARICRFCDRDQAAPPPPAPGTAVAPAMIFTGHVRHRAYLGEYLLYGLLSLVGIGIPFLVWRWLKTISELWTIDAARIEHSRGIISKRIDSMELWRVRDVAYQQSLTDRLLGEGRIVLLTSDTTHPTLVVAGLPGSRAIYERVRAAVEQSRRTHRVMAVEDA